jgi:hypothetical protein
MFVETINGLVDQGTVTLKALGDLAGRQAFIQEKKDSTPGDFNGIPGFVPAPFDATAKGPIKVRSNYIHDREVLLQGLSSFVTTQRTQKASLFNAAHPDPTAHLDPYPANLIPID